MYNDMTKLQSVAAWLSQEKSYRPTADSSAIALHKLTHVMVSHLALDKQAAEEIVQSLSTENMVHYSPETKRIEVHPTYNPACSLAIQNLLAREKVDCSVTKEVKRHLQGPKSKKKQSKAKERKQKGEEISSIRQKKVTPSSAPTTRTQTGKRPLECIREETGSQPSNKKVSRSNTASVAGNGFSHSKPEKFEGNGIHMATSSQLQPKVSPPPPVIHKDSNVHVKKKWTSLGVSDWMSKHSSRQPKGVEEHCLKKIAEVLQQQLGLQLKEAKTLTMEMLTRDLIKYSKSEMRYVPNSEPLNVALLLEHDRKSILNDTQVESFFGKLIKATKPTSITGCTNSVQVAKNVNVTYTYTADAKEVNKWLGEKLGDASFKESHATGDSNVHFVGLDVEKKPVFKVKDARSPPATIQIAYSNDVLVFHAYHCNEFPERLRNVLENTSVVKAGVGIGADARALLIDCGVKIRGAVDLEQAACQLEFAKEGCGLKKLSQVFLPWFSLSWKEKGTTLSNWETPLSRKQLHYAVFDAWLSGSLCRSMVYRLEKGLLPSEEDFEEPFRIEREIFNLSEVCSTMLLDDHTLWLFSRRQKFKLDDMRSNNLL